MQGNKKEHLRRSHPVRDAHSKVMGVKSKCSGTVIWRSRILCRTQRRHAQSIGTHSILKDMRVHVGVAICTDASEAKGIASRRGLGKVRHIDVSQLWIQDNTFKREIDIVKVRTNANLADALPNKKIRQKKSAGTSSMQDHISH
jgi:hypothetical protein